MANLYQILVDTYDTLLQIPPPPLFDHTEQLPTREIALPKVNAPRVAIFSPHPDDECIMGALPLRLMQELGCSVTNIAVTLGSDPARQAARRQELQSACHYLGFEVILAAGTGLNAVTPLTRAKNKKVWQAHVTAITTTLQRLQPDIIVLPHQEDGHITHQGTHTLVMDALKVTQQQCWIVQTEFWQPLTKPNLMLACSKEELVILMTGLACHRGEVSRSPYHLRLPVWMADNVRRGAERLAGQGATAPCYSFATLYRVDKWEGKQLIPITDNYFIDTEQKLARVFQGCSPV
jgi:LmbE family N-acetylglucosaminyl deacetylase